MKDREITDHGTLRVDDTTFRVTDQHRPASGLYLLAAGDGVRELRSLEGQTQVVIGRGEGCWMRIESSAISRQHVRLYIEPMLAVEDLGSANGTFVGGRRIATGTRVPVGVGQVVELGSIVLVVHQGAPAASEAAPPTASTTTMPAPPRVPREAALADGTPVVVLDPVMQRLYDVIARIAPSDLSVLILGETGVGKEVVAEAVHRCSHRADGPLMRLHCAALPPSLLESELFGYERGAFTGATQGKVGLIEAAAGGTVLLDEVGEIPLDMQVRLLRVLEDHRVMRIGGREARTIDVRFVAATNRDLTAEIARGAFRRDLYYRLNGITLEVPSLRERPEEIESLARLYLSRAGTRRATLSTEARDAIRTHAWPGNVRELRNAMERAALLVGDGIVQLEHLPPEIARGPAKSRSSRPPAASPEPPTAPAASTGAPPSAGSAASHREVLARVEKERIAAALEATAGNQTRAAELLGMPRRTLVKRLAEYGIARPRKRDDE